jgi:hypothetical protein
VRQGYRLSGLLLEQNDSRVHVVKTICSRRVLGKGGGHVIFNVGGWWLMFHAGDINLVWQALGDV